MPQPSAPPSHLTVALLGNPNTGKSTLFSALAGIPTRIGNYPGVTVEEKVGRFTHRGMTIDLVDLPGSYSFTPQSPDEQVAIDVLRGRMADVSKPDCVVVAVDATNLERNLYLAIQAMELGLPMVIALTLSDVAAAKGITIDDAALADRLGCPVVRVVAPTGEGIATLGDRILAAPHTPPPPPPDLSRHLAAIDGTRPQAAREAIARYAWIDRVVEGVVSRSAPARRPDQRESQRERNPPHLRRRPPRHGRLGHPAPAAGGRAPGRSPPHAHPRRSGPD